ncbi:MAG: DUF1499 domain-containing protein [Balneolaceae bacterium]
MQFWIFVGLFTLGILIVLNLYGPLKGSTSADFSSANVSLKNPLKPCPSSPNCTSTSVLYNLPAKELYETVFFVMEKSGAEKIKPNSQELQIDVVFRIPIFGFKDDVVVKIDSYNSNSVLFIKSSSRLGEGDLGVNRRRVSKLLSEIETNLNQPL